MRSRWGRRRPASFAGWCVAPVRSRSRSVIPRARPFEEALARFAPGLHAAGVVPLFEDGVGLGVEGGSSVAGRLVVGLDGDHLLGLGVERVKFVLVADERPGEVVGGEGVGGAGAVAGGAHDLLAGALAFLLVGPSANVLLRVRHRWPPRG